jgi:AraC-like DNA-binding protein
MKVENFDELVLEVADNQDARCAGLENQLRRDLASAIEEARTEQNLSIRQLAERMGTSVSQAQRLLHHDLGGSLTLRTICRAIDSLGLCVTMHTRRRVESPASLISFGNASWTRATTAEKYHFTQAPRQPASRARESDGWQRIAGEPDAPTAIEERVA